MKIAIITDQHFGCRKNSKHFHDYFLKFYNDTFFPTLEREGITTVIDMGDTFDSRKGVDFSSLAWAKDNYYDRLQRMGCEIHTIVGNHTAYYKNTNDVNAVDLLLREYDNVKIYSEATDIKIDGLNILLIPWINSENEEMTLQAIDKSKSKVAMGITLNVKDLEFIVVLSWIKELMSRHLVSLIEFILVTITQDLMMEKYFI